MFKYKQVYDVDEQGLIKEIYAVEFDGEGNPVDDLPESYVLFDPPRGLWRPKWRGEEWVEGKTRVEFEEDDFIASLTPSAEEIEAAEFELKTLNILMEVGLI